jgi:hypothetical protein
VIPLIFQVVFVWVYVMLMVYLHLPPVASPDSLVLSTGLVATEEKHDAVGQRLKKARSQHRWVVIIIIIIVLIIVITITILLLLTLTPLVCRRQRRGPDSPPPPVFCLERALSCFQLARQAYWDLPGVPPLKWGNVDVEQLGYELVSGSYVIIIIMMMMMMLMLMLMIPLAWDDEFETLVLELGMTMMTTTTTTTMR